MAFVPAAVGLVTQVVYVIGIVTGSLVWLQQLTVQLDFSVTALFLHQLSPRVH